MMKRFSLLLALAACVIGARGQEVVTGTVIDSKKNPIPGVLVEVVGTDQSVITQLDGTFSLPAPAGAKKVRAQYAGMNKRTVKIKPDMVIKMTNASWWSSRPDRYEWLVGVQAASPSNHASDMGYGVMGAFVKKFGVYVKAMSNFKDLPGAFTQDDTYGSYHTWLRDEVRCSYMSFSAGGMWRIGPPIYIYAGMGYTKRKVAWRDTDGIWIEPDHNFDNYYTEYKSAAKVSWELGAMIRFGHVALNGGVTWLPNMYRENGLIPQFGVGYFF